MPLEKKSSQESAGSSARLFVEASTKFKLTLGNERVGESLLKHEADVSHDSNKNDENSDKKDQTKFKLTC